MRSTLWMPLSLNGPRNSFRSSSDILAKSNCAARVCVNPRAMTPFNGGTCSLYVFPPSSTLMA